MTLFPGIGKALLKLLRQVLPHQGMGVHAVRVPRSRFAQQAQPAQSRQRTLPRGSGQAHHRLSQPLNRWLGQQRLDLPALRRPVEQAHQAQQCPLSPLPQPLLVGHDQPLRVESFRVFLIQQGHFSPTAHIAVVNFRQVGAQQRQGQGVAAKGVRGFLQFLARSLHPQLGQQLLPSLR